ncbi:MAG: tripartite tricarboxylate transporter TctB family protein [Bacillota bacterium]
MRFEADQVVGLVLAALGAGVMLVSRSYPAGRVGPGPGTLPFLLGAALFLLASYLVAAPFLGRSRGMAARKEEPAGSGRSWLNVVLAAILLAAYIGAIGVLGYPLSTVLFVLAHTVLVYRRSWKPGLLWGIGVAAGCYFLFSWLGVPLPKGFLLGG